MKNSHLNLITMTPSNKYGKTHLLNNLLLITHKTYQMLSVILVTLTYQPNLMLQHYSIFSERTFKLNLSLLKPLKRPSN